MQQKLDRTQQLEKFRGLYRPRGKEGKSRLLDEFCEHYGSERKYAIKLLGQAVGPALIKKSRPGLCPRMRR